MRRWHPIARLEYIRTTKPTYHEVLTLRLLVAPNGLGSGGRKRAAVETIGSFTT